MNRTILLTCLIVSLITTVCNQKLYAQYQLKGWVFGSGGGTTSNDNYTVISTLGQPGIGMIQNDNFLLHSGFWYAAAPGIITSAEMVEDYIPQDYRLEQNFPNPFNPSTQIRFSIPEHNTITLKIYDILGRKLTVLLDDELDPGMYTVSFEASNLPSGMYLYRLQAGLFIETKRMILLR